LALHLSTEEQVQIATGIRAGDRQAEEDLVRIFEGRIQLMLAVRTRDEDGARDLTQEVLMNVITAIRDGQLRQPESLAAFVYGIARNLLAGHLRSRRVPELSLDEELPIAAPSFDFERSERTAIVRKALGSLNRGDRGILLLSLVEGMKPGEIAERIGVSPEVIRTRKSRALRRVMDLVNRLTRKPM
jgi:RNA polymerase sigma factor (sigma-70 family)